MELALLCNLMVGLSRQSFIVQSLVSEYLPDFDILLLVNNAAL